MRWPLQLSSKSRHALRHHTTPVATWPDRRAVGEIPLNFGLSKNLCRTIFVQKYKTWSSKSPILEKVKVKINILSTHNPPCRKCGVFIGNCNFLPPATFYTTTPLDHTQTDRVPNGQLEHLFVNLTTHRASSCYCWYQCAMIFYDPINQQHFF